MNFLTEVFIGVIICCMFMLVAKYFFMRYDHEREATFQSNLFDFELAIKKNNVREINRLGARLVNNPFLKIPQLRSIMLAVADYKLKMKPKKDSLKKVETAIRDRQINWGLFANRFSDPEEYQHALNDIVNLP